MALNVALVTNERPHHKFFVTEMAKHVNVRCVLHPVGSKARRFKSPSLGLPWKALQGLSKAYRSFSSNTLQKDFSVQSDRFFAPAARDYADLDPQLLYRVDSINTPESLDIVRRHRIDVVCFLGGDIARREFIEATRSCLNLHSGLSPLYNGTSSYAWVVVDGRPNLAGVTLMHMSERIDGGKVLAHFVPKIEPSDTASSLFMKGIEGSIGLYREAISRMDSTAPFDGIPQPRSLRYTRSHDWTIYQDLKLARFHRGNRMKLYEREARTFLYDESDLRAEFPFGDLLAYVLRKPQK